MLTELGLTPEQAQKLQSDSPQFASLVSWTLNFLKFIQLSHPTIVDLLAPLTDPEAELRLKGYIGFLRHFLPQRDILMMVQSPQGEDKIKFLLSKIDALKTSGLDAQQIKVLLLAPHGLRKLKIFLIHQPLINACLKSGYTLPQMVEISAKPMGFMRLICFLQQRSFLESDRYALLPQHIVAVYSAPIPYLARYKGLPFSILQQISLLGREPISNYLIAKLIINNDFKSLKSFNQFIAHLVRIHSYRARGQS